MLLAIMLLTARRITRAGGGIRTPTSQRDHHMHGDVCQFRHPGMIENHCCYDPNCNIRYATTLSSVSPERNTQAIRNYFTG
jgi:hypothetical protein